MTTMVLNVITNPFAGFYKGFHNFFVSVGRARACAELHRMGLVKEAKTLMFDDSMFIK